MTKRPDPKTGDKRKTARYGKGKRYRVAGIPGVADASFTRLDDAKAWLNKASADAAHGTFIDPRDGDITLREYFEKHWWPAQRFPPSTKEGVEQRITGHVLPHLGALPLRKIGTDQVNAWAVAAEADLSPNTVRTTWRHLSSMLQSAKEAKRIADNPCRGYSTARPPAKPKGKARALTARQAVDIRAALPDRYQILLDLGIGVGIRQGEAFGFSPDDVRDGEVHIARQVLRIRSRLCFGPPKGNIERDVPLAESLNERIKTHAKAFPTVDVTLPWVDPDLPNMRWEDRPMVTVPLLVTTNRGGAVNRANWNEDNWKPALGAAGMIEPLKLTKAQIAARKARRAGPVAWPEAREYGFHLTRHTYASVQLQHGASPVALAKWLGHKDPAFTLRTYTHFMPESSSLGVTAVDEWLSRAL